jgi:phosphatidylglycerol:prolipoprotein diacylglycerol transferase
MYQALPFGPITLPTGPILAMLAVFLGLETAGRFGRRLGLRTDDVWNAGLLAVLAGLIVARLWHVFQFWYVYAAEPTLIVSLRPSGFALWPGLAAAFVAGYAYMLRRALSPVRIAAAFAVGALMAASVLAVSDYLTGAILGLPSDLPWARPYYGAMQHPAALYRAVGFLISIVVIWLFADPQRPGRTVGYVALAAGLVVLGADAFAANSPVTGALRISQLVGLGLALVAAAGLAATTHHAAPSREPIPATEPPAAS